LAQSHIKLTGGIGDGTSVRNTITQASHGFSAGQAIRFNRSTGAGEQYFAADASSADNSEVIGVIENVVGANEFVLVYSGEIDTGQFDSQYAVVDDEVFFLDATTPGKLTNIPPSSAGQVIKPVLTRAEGNKAVVTNYIGTVIGGSSVVSLDSIQPVGTIEPFAGAVDDIPDTWGLCDGSAVEVSTYPDLYTRLGSNYGYYQKITLSAGSLPAELVVGNVVETGGSSNTMRGIVVEKGSNYVVIDTDYLQDSGDGFVPHSYEWTDATDIVVKATPTGSFTGSLFRNTSSTNTNISEQLTVATAGDFSAVTSHVRKPDLRGKVVLGLADSDTGAGNRTGTAIAADQNFIRGQIGGEYEHILTPAELGINTGSVGANTNAGSPLGHNNLQPYVGINYIIKLSSLAQASILDNIDLKLPLVELTDVTFPSGTQDGDLIMFDVNGTLGNKFRPYRLFTSYTSDVNTFQIDVDDTGSVKPKIKFGSASETASFGINLSGLGSASGNSFVVKNNSNTILEAKNPSGTDDTGYVGVGAAADSTANLKIGAKGLKFSASSPVVTQIRTGIRTSGSTDNTSLVTETAIRTAIDSSPKLVHLETHATRLGGLPSSNTNFATGTFDAGDYGVPTGATHIQINWTGETTGGLQAYIFTNYSAGTSINSNATFKVLYMTGNINNRDIMSVTEILPVDADGKFTLSKNNQYKSSSWQITGYIA